MNSDPAVNPPCAFWILNLMITRLPDINKAYYADTIARWQEAAQAIDINKLLLINKNNDLTEMRAKLDVCISNMPGVYRNNDFIALNAAVSRKLKPAGFVISEADGKIIWRRFNDAPVSGEAWILDDRGGFIVAGSYQNTGLKAKISAPAFAKLVFTPTDGRSTVALQNELLLEKSGITLPGSWPIIIQ